MFPNQAPYILLMGMTGNHQNLSQQNYVLHPKLNNWTAHSNLAFIFQEIAQAFVSNPPKKIQHTQSYSQFQSSPVQHYQPQQSFGTTQSFTSGQTVYQPQSQQSFYQPQQQVVQKQQQVQQVQKPQDKVSRLTLPTTFNEVKLLGETKQQALLSNEEELNSFVNQLDIVKNMQQMLDDLNAENKKLQINCLGKEKLVQESKQGNTVLKNEFKIANDSYEVKKRLQDEKQGKFTPQILADTLRKAMNDADEKSSNIGDKFLSNKGEDVNAFLSEFLKEREIYYTRKTKLERFKL